MRTVSFIAPDEGRSGAGITEALTGTGGGCGGWKNFGGASGRAGCCSGKTGTGGSRTGNWMRTVSRDFVVGSGGFSAAAGAKGKRVVSFFGSFDSVIELNNYQKFAQKKDGCHVLSRLC